MRIHAVDETADNGFAADSLPRPVFFLSDSTGITAETLGNTLLTQFGSESFSRTTVPFITTAGQAEDVVASLNDLANTGPTPLAFSTVVTEDVRAVLGTSNAILIDLFGSHVRQLENALGTKASAQPGRAHGLGNAARYQSRMTAVEYAMEHDDGQSLRALEKAEVILVAPSRCGKTPTTMYLALQHGIFAANFPLIEEDFGTDKLPEPLTPFVNKCFGLTSTPLRLSQIRTGRRPSSAYASLRQCEFELRNAEGLYRSHGIPHISSANMSVEEMSAVILQRMHLRR
jgi:[pyruvate, water dikinase]-phosphate phosphotransferase / [pyruvate, water dikinase] kinase